MADQQNRGGKKQGGNDPDHPTQQQGVHPGEATSRGSSKPSNQGRKADDGPRDNGDDPSEAPESGDKKNHGNG